MKKPFRPIALCMLVAIATSHAVASDQAASPADGYTIHIVAPHRQEDGTVHGPYHHYCKAISADVMQCMIFKSTDPNAELVEIEYFISKGLVRTNVTLSQWNRYYHDHAEEIATGHVQVLDVSPSKAKELGAAAAKTDGIIFHLWPEGAKVPNGEVSYPTAIGHKPVEKLDIPK
jgi:hypothetical protein